MIEAATLLKKQAESVVRSGQHWREPHAFPQLGLRLDNAARTTQQIAEIDARLTALRSARNGGSVVL